MQPGGKPGKTGGLADVAALTEPDAQERLILLFERIAATEGWQPGDALRRYRERSVYFAASLDGEMQGGAQLVLPDAVEGLPGREVWPEIEQTGEGTSAHVAVLALLPQARGHVSLFGRLCVELWRTCRSLGVQTLWLEATPGTLRVYRRLGWPLEVVGELRRHWGEECCLCRMGVEAVSQALRQKALRSAFGCVRAVPVPALPAAPAVCPAGPVPGRLGCHSPPVHLPHVARVLALGGQAQLRGRCGSDHFRLPVRAGTGGQKAKRHGSFMAENSAVGGDAAAVLRHAADGAGG